MIMNFFRVILVLGLFLGASAPQSAYAQEDRMTRARVHYEKGKRFFKEGRYDDALRELDKAYRLDPNESLVFNIARVHEERGDLISAVRYYKSYLAINPRAKNARDVRKTIRRLQSMTHTGRLVVTSSPPGATIWINGRNVGITPSKSMVMKTGVSRVELKMNGYATFAEDVLINKGQTSRLSATLQPPPDQVLIQTRPPRAQATIFLPETKALGACPCRINLRPGRYRLRIHAPGYLTSDIQIVKLKGQPLQVPVNLDPMQPGLVPEFEATETDTPEAFEPDSVIIDDESGSQTTWGWVCVSTGIASVLGGGAFTTLAMVNKYNYDNGSYYRPDPEQPNVLFRYDISQVDGLELESEAKTYLNISYGLYAAGGAAIATGIFLILTDDGSTDDDTVALETSPIFSVSPLPGGAMAQYGFHF